MSHLDELYEFEAELELQLKKEYTAVFPLFRYCVLTQDATYLCNKLDLQPIPQPSYPFFHVKMEDVWVWDKNRPSRIIPRAEVYTSSDVTVEELRGERDLQAVDGEAPVDQAAGVEAGLHPLSEAVDPDLRRPVRGALQALAAEGAPLPAREGVGRGEGADRRDQGRDREAGRRRRPD